MGYVAKVKFYQLTDIVILICYIFLCLPTLKDFESECWEFESLPHQKYQRITYNSSPSNY